MRWTSGPAERVGRSSAVEQLFGLEQLEAVGRGFRGQLTSQELVAEYTDGVDVSSSVEGQHWAVQQICAELRSRVFGRAGR